jgi:hypothetical protein
LFALFLSVKSRLEQQYLVDSDTPVSPKAENAKTLLRILDDIHIQHLLHQDIDLVDE